MWIQFCTTFESLCSVFQVGTNGIISFDSEFTRDLPESFPAMSDPEVFISYLVAPYWSNIDTR